jgi:GT2 family glycosyltransferase
MQAKKNYFIAVNYNNSNETFEYINSINSTEKGNYKIIIIDNNSSTEDINKLEEFCRDKVDVVLIKNVKNVGYFPALNVGLENIDSGDSEYVIIGNNDLSFDTGFLDQLSSIKISDDTLVIAPNIIKFNKVHQNPHILKKFNLVQRLYRKLYYSNYYVSVVLQIVYNQLKMLNGGSDRKLNDRVMPILMGYGACYILTPNFFRYYKKLDAPLFLMGEEGIIANQVLRAGGKTIYYPDLIVYHRDHSSIGKLPGKSLYRYSQLAYRYFIKNCNYVR